MRHAGKRTRILRGGSSFAIIGPVSTRYSVLGYRTPQEVLDEYLEMQAAA